MFIADDVKSTVDSGKFGAGFEDWFVGARRHGGTAWVLMQSWPKAGHGSGPAVRMNAQRTVVARPLDFAQKMVKSDTPVHFADPKVGKAKIEAVATTPLAAAVLGKGNKTWKFVAGAPDRSGGPVGDAAKNGNLVDASGDAVTVDGVVQPPPAPAGADGDDGDDDDDDGDDDDGGNDDDHWDGNNVMSDLSDDDSTCEDDEEREDRRRSADDDGIDDRDRQRARRVEAVAAEQDELMVEMEQLRLRLAGARTRVDELGTAHGGRGRPRGTDRRHPDGTLVAPIVGIVTAVASVADSAEDQEVATKVGRLLQDEQLKNLGTRNYNRVPMIEMANSIGGTSLRLLPLQVIEQLGRIPHSTEGLAVDAADALGRFKFKSAAFRHQGIGAEVFMASHRWLREQHPDNEANDKAKALIEFGQCRQQWVRNRHQLNVTMFLWIDVCCVDQSNPVPDLVKLPLAIACCERMVTFVADGRQDRGWCRLEQLLAKRCMYADHQLVIGTGCPNSCRPGVEEEWELQDPSTGRLTKEADRPVITKLTEAAGHTAGEAALKVYNLMN